MVNQPFRILVVDDDALSREFLSLVLAREGYIVETAESGDAACQALSQPNTVIPHAILADLQMPGSSGSTLAQRLREICGQPTRLIAISGSSAPPSTLDSFDAFLEKSFTMESLAAAITGNSASSVESVHRNATVLDQSTYDRLSSSMRPELVQQLYTLCLSDARRREAALRKAAGSGDNTAFRREAHALKGGCGMVGAVELQMIAATMETSGIPANYLATLDEFLVACNRLERMLFARETAQDHSVTAKVARRSTA